MKACRAQQKTQYQSSREPPESFHTTWKLAGTWQVGFCYMGYRGSLGYEADLLNQPGIQANSIPTHTHTHTCLLDIFGRRMSHSATANGLASRDAFVGG